MDGIQSYNEFKAAYDQMKNVSNYEEAVAANNAAIGIYKPPRSNKNDPWIPAGQEDQVSVTVTPQPEYGMEWTDWASLIFPPALLWKATDPTPVGGDPMPFTTVTGAPGALGEFLKENPIIQTTPPVADPLSGLGSTVDLIVKFLPIILVVGLFTSIKKVF